MESNSFGELSRKLAINQITNSIVNFEDSDISKVFDKSKAVDLSKFRKDSRYILIIGAGASSATSEKIPLAKKASDDIFTSLQTKYKDVFSTLVSRELKKLSQVYKLDPQDFETKLLAMGKFFPDDVLMEIKSAYNKKYEVSLFYEIVGHMLKHRFIDAIVNYNFDEILDNVIEEELKHSKFPTIYSDGHCPRSYTDDLLHVNKSGLMYPLYIKPHGTISHPSTLRFTRESYFNISKEIKDLLTNLFKGVDREQNPKFKINLIVVGFGMRSFELNQIIQETQELYDDKIEAYIFDNMSREVYEDSLKQDIGKKLSIKYFQSTQDNDISTQFKKLWQETTSLYEHKYKPKSIYRHEFISLLFGHKKKKLNGYPEEKKYFLHRVYAEIIILILESDGMINWTLIRESRVYKYYRLYKLANGRETLSALLESMGLSGYKEYVRDTLTFNKREFFSKSEDLCIALYDSLYKIFSKELENNNDTLIRLREKRDEIIGRLFQGIKNRNLLNVKYDESIIYTNTFDHIIPENIIRTDLDWGYRFRKFIEMEQEWDILLTISEHGRFLFKDQNKELLKNKKCEVIVSSSDLEPYYPFEISNDEYHFISEKILSLPWWLHNQHLVLFAKKSEKETGIIKNIELTRGFYYTSRLLKRTVTPIEVTEPTDLKTLLNIFTTYWIRAKSYIASDYMEVGNPKGVDEIEKAYKKIFQSRNA